MKPFVLVLLLSVVTAATYASTNRSVEEHNSDNAEEIVSKRNFWDKLKHVAKKVGDKAKEAVDKVGDVAKDAGKKIGNIAKDAVDQVEHVAKNVGKTSKKVVDDIVKTFKVQGKFVSHFVTKSGKEVGHLFAQEGKQISHTLVVAGKKIEHIGGDVFEEVRDELQKKLKNIDYDAVLRKLVSMIDSGITESACAEISKKAVTAIQPELEPAVEAHGPLIKKLCSVALHLIEMGAQEGVKHVHINH